LCLAKREADNTVRTGAATGKIDRCVTFESVLEGGGIKFVGLHFPDADENEKEYSHAHPNLGAIAS
jgi:hypothetical protein